MLLLLYSFGQAAAILWPSPWAGVLLVIGGICIGLDLARVLHQRWSA